MVSKNTICLWFDGTALDAAQFYAATFPDSAVKAIHRAPGDYPAGKEGDAKSVDLTLGAIHALDADTKVQAKADSKGLVSANYIQTIKPKPTAYGTPSSATAARKACAAGARINGACHGRSRRACSPPQSATPIAQRPSALSMR